MDESMPKDATKLIVLNSLTLRDFIVCSFLLSRAVIINKRNAVLYLAVLAAAVAQLILFPETIPAFSTLVWLALFVPMFLFMFIPLFLLVSSCSFYSRNRNKMQNIITTITTEDISVQGTAAGVSSTYLWRAILAVEFVAEFIMIQISKHPRYDICIPIRCFESPEKAREFFYTARNNWKLSLAKPLRSDES